MNEKLIETDNKNIAKYTSDNIKLVERIKALERKIELYEISTKIDKEKIDDLTYKIKLYNTLC